MLKYLRSTANKLAKESGMRITNAQDQTAQNLGFADWQTLMHEYNKGVYELWLDKGVWYAKGKSQRERLDLRLDLANHSPTGFAWGYLGSGPSQTALAILAHAKGDEAALTNYRQFKEQVIAKLNQERSHVIPASKLAPYHKVESESVGFVFYIDPVQHQTWNTNHPEEYIPSRVKVGQSGHQPLLGPEGGRPWLWGDLETALDICKQKNAELGYTEEEATKIVAASMVRSPLFPDFEIDGETYKSKEVWNLLVGAFEGGSNYWYWVQATNAQEYPQVRYFHSLPITHNGWLDITEIERQDDEDREVWRLDRKAVERGLRLLRTKRYVRRYANWVEGDYDNLDCDDFLQLCLFGELRFG